MNITYISTSIKKSSEVNNCDSIGSVVEDLSAQHGGPRFNAGNFLTFFIHFFLSCGDCSI